MSSETDARLGRIEQEIADIKGTLAQMMPILVRLVEGQAIVLQQPPKRQS